MSELEPSHQALISGIDAQACQEGSLSCPICFQQQLSFTLEQTSGHLWELSQLGHASKPKLKMSIDRDSTQGHNVDGQCTIGAGDWSRTVHATRCCSCWSYVTLSSACRACTTACASCQGVLCVMVGVSDTCYSFPRRASLTQNYLKLICFGCRSKICSLASVIQGQMSKMERIQARQSLSL